ncbi:SAVED domain-containing protein [Corallococcus exiguus]|uniref:SAVED domain-containing protein n=1 Tax=Corallococcus exiguus TaxID=83462 RepID=UPI0015611981|nr:SAVED domain-containing protein [Corallococcus exiguus]NRD43296.1 SAVED domain-containing protein [Corallococcus exiguus]
MNSYKELHLYFTKGEKDLFRIAVHSDSIGSASGTAPLNLTVSRMHELRDQIAKALRQSISRSVSVNDELKRLGQELYEAIFPEGRVRGVLTALVGALTSPESKQQRLRLCMHFAPEDADLAWLAEFPWDVLRIPQFFGAHHAALDHRLSIVRWLDVTQPLRTLTFASPLRVLMVRAGARGHAGLQYAKEQDSITDALSKIPGIHCESLTLPTRQELRDKLLDFSPHVLHFMGHGNVDDDTGNGQLYLQDENGVPDLLRGQDVAELLTGIPPLQLVVLNTCQSARGTLSVDGHCSLAEALVNQGAVAVIAMQFSISDEAALAFSSAFYARLATRASIDDAVTEGRLAIRAKMRDSFEWCTPALYMRGGAAAVLLQPELSVSSVHTGNTVEPPPASGTSRKPLILIRHEAYMLAPQQPEPADAPLLFAGRTSRIVDVDQRASLEQRDWRNLEAEVKRLASREGELRRTFAERDADIGYFGFPFVPLAVLAGYLAKNRQVHVFEYLSDRFRWEPDSDTPPPPLNVDVQTRKEGRAARIFVSVSAPVNLGDCRQVLPDSDVRLDLHFALKDTGRGSVRRESQLKAYVQVIRETLNKHIASNQDPECRPESVHIFAAVPVSLAFCLGDALTASWLPECFIYNYGLPSERPRYKWRLSLQAAFEGRRSIKFFK